MARHLIVTCGTSHIEQRKLVTLRLDRDPWYANLADDNRPIDDDRIKYWPEHRKFETVVEALQREWPRLRSFIRHPENPFGAEISTLAKMEEANEWSPAEDTITLLYSDTEAGAFCAAVVRYLLEEKWGVPKANIEAKRVVGLKEEPENAIIAEKNFSEAVKEAMKEGHTNVIVMTGGFKSVVPCLTIYALLFGIEMFYLFERSDQLQRIHLPVEKVPLSLWQVVRQQWRSKAPQAMIVALEHRLQNPNVVF
jgi:putative CRISPR-associated protein (TIGR02619 family)